MRTGYQLAIGVAAVTLIAAVAVLIGEAISSIRDASAYGDVAVPGRDSVSLPQGEVVVFYGERIGRFEHSPLAVPPGLRVQVRTTRGQLLGSTPSGFDQFNDGDYVRRSIAKLDIPEGGAYEAVSSGAAPGSVEPVVSFGSNGTRNFAYALFVLAGGTILALILAIGTRLVERREREPST
jgi:hypothetical protein